MFALLPLFFVILCFPLSLIGAEQKIQTSSHFSLVIHTPQHKIQQHVDTLYGLASSTLTQFEPRNETTISNLLHLIDKIASFKLEHNSNLTQMYNELYIGSVAYTQPPLFKHTIGLEPNPHTISLFFYQLHNYDQTIRIKNKITPDVQDWRNMQYNKTMRQQQKQAFPIGQTFGINIDPTSINYNKPPFAAINNNIATKEFTTLLHHIAKLINTKNSCAIRALADLIYLNIVMPTQ